MHGINSINSVMGLGWIIGIANLVVLVWLIIRFLVPRQNTKVKNNQSPLDILNGRYAKGEIEKDEYLEKKMNHSWNET